MAPVELGDDFVTAPVATYAKLREQGSVHRAITPDGAAVWLMTRYEDVRAALADPRLSLDKAHARDGYQGFALPPALDANLLNMDAPRHTRLRRITAQAFRVHHLRPQVAALAEELIDEFAGSGHTDLMTAYAGPLPIAVITELFGVPEQMRASLRHIVDEVFRTSATPEETAATAQEMAQFLADLIEHKRHHPAADLTSGLLAARDEQENRLSERELADTLILMIGAGHETTVNLLGQAVVALTTHPEQLAMLRNGEVSWDDVVEETLRWEPALANVPLRFATTDIPLPDGTVIAEGDAILASYAAGNRDPGRYAEPDEFDARRGARDHLAFGHGPHFCLGAALARLEAHIALPALFERFPKLELAVSAGELPPTESFISNGYQQLPVRLG